MRRLSVDVFFVKSTIRRSYRKCSVKKVFLKISQNSQVNTCARYYFLINLQARSATLLIKRIWYRCFPVNSVRTPFLQNTSGRLLLPYLLATVQNNNRNFLEAYLRPCDTSAIQPFCKNSYKLLAVNCFLKKTLSYVFDKARYNTPSLLDLSYLTD